MIATCATNSSSYLWRMPLKLPGRMYKYVVAKTCVPEKAPMKGIRMRLRVNGKIAPSKKDLS